MASGPLNLDLLSYGLKWSAASSLLLKANELEGRARTVLVRTHDRSNLLAEARLHFVAEAGVGGAGLFQEFGRPSLGGSAIQRQCASFFAGSANQMLPVDSV